MATTMMAGEPVDGALAEATAVAVTATAGAEAEATVEPYLDKHEVARRFGCTTRTVDNMMRRGTIPFYKLGYRVAFRWSEIQNHLTQTFRVSTTKN